MNILINRRGDIAVTLLVFVALIAFITLAFIFVDFNKKIIYDESQEVLECVNEINFAQDYVFDKTEIMARSAIAKTFIDDQHSLKENFQITAAENSDIGDIALFGNYFAKIKEGGFIFESRGDGYYFEIEDVFVSSTRDLTRAKISFDVKMEFGESGNLRKVYKD